MALATRCPHCQTTFRVAHDQLKLRAGLVRCGSCKEIFNGIEHLLRPDEAATPSQAPVPARTPPPAFTPEFTPEFTPSFASSFAPAQTPALPPAPESSFSSALPPSMPVAAIPSAFVAEVAVEPVSHEDAAVEITPPAPLHTPETANDHAGLTLDAAPAPHAADAHAEPAQPADAKPMETAAHVPVKLHDSQRHEVMDPLQRMTLMQLSDDEESPAPLMAESEPGASGKTAPVDVAPVAPDELDQAIDFLQRKPWRGTKRLLTRDDVEGGANYDSDAEEPSFLVRARRRAARSRRSSRPALWLPLTFLLLLGALGQSVYVMRDQLAVRAPALAPWLHQACAVLGCKVDLPAQIDAVSIESNELVALNQNKNSFGLNLLLRNRASIVERWPNIELTLLDANDRAVVRRVFSASEYLARSAEAAKGFAPNSEQSIKIAFELRQQKAANYRVYLFYP